MTGRASASPTSDSATSRRRFKIWVRAVFRHEYLAGLLLVERGPVLDLDAPHAAVDESLGRKVSAAIHLGDHDQIGPGFLYQGGQILDLSQQDMRGGDRLRSIRVVVEEPDDLERPCSPLREAGDHLPYGSGPEHEYPDLEAAARERAEPDCPPGNEPDRGRRPNLEERGASKTEAREGESHRRDEQPCHRLAGQEPSKDLPMTQGQSEVIESPQIEHEPNEEADHDEPRNDGAFRNPGSSERRYLESQCQDGEVAQ
jgi:hypothetical protein